MTRKDLSGILESFQKLLQKILKKKIRKRNKKFLFVMLLLVFLSFFFFFCNLKEKNIKTKHRKILIGKLEVISHLISLLQKKRNI